jgi:hypothetical protein
MNEAPPKVRLTGILLADQWSTGGHTTEIAIYTDREEIYRCARNEMSSLLFDLIQRRVSIEGELTFQHDGRHLINVKNFRLVEENNGNQ